MSKQLVSALFSLGAAALTLVAWKLGAPLHALKIGLFISMLAAFGAVA